MTFGSLFTGVGGFDLGFERAGWRCAWQVEIDPQCQGVLRRHFGRLDLKHGSDVRHVTPSDFVRPELVCGGPPCQDLSVAGRRAGLAGERSGLFYEFMRVVADFAPRWVLVENVPGLLSSNEGRDMGAVLGTLEELGYGTAYRVLDAQWLGVPQRRERVFIVGCSGTDWRRAAKVLFEPESLPWDPPPSREAEADIANTLTSSAGRRGSGIEDSMIVVRAISTREGYRMGDAQDTLIPFDTTNLTSKHNRSNPKAGDPLHTLASGAHPPAVAYQCHGSNVGPMGCLRAGNGNATGGVPFAGGEWGVRRLMPVEMERCQGFPDDWTRFDDQGNEISDTARTRMLGNAVAVPVGEWLARRILSEERDSDG